MDNVKSTKKWTIPSLPFVWSPLESPANGSNLPNELPFSLSVDPSTGCVIQMPDDEVKSALSKAYIKGSVLSGLMDDEGIGRMYAEDFLAFVLKVVPEAKLANLKVLEIGWGNGYLLSRLAGKGANVLGIEPGDHGQLGAKKWEVPIIQDNFPSNAVIEKFDLVLSFAVLEHVDNPVEFMSLIKHNLSDDGVVIMAVPDESPYIASGDVSTLFHEHWSYFDINALINTVRLAGYKEFLCELSGYGGSIYCAMNKSMVNVELSRVAVASAIIRANQYIDQARKHIQILDNYIREIQSKGSTLAVYVPGRAINTLSIANTSLGSIRFVDDNPLLHDTYFPGFNIPIESRQALIAKPTENVIIMSRTFGPQLAIELKAQLIADVNIVTIDDVLSLTHAKTLK